MMIQRICIRHGYVGFFVHIIRDFPDKLRYTTVVSLFDDCITVPEIDKLFPDSNEPGRRGYGVCSRVFLPLLINNAPGLTKNTA